MNIRKRFEIAPASITEDLIADGAVTEDKIANASIVEAKIANLAVKTAHLQDNLVTLAKADNDVRLNTYVGDETVVSAHDETAVKEFTFPISSGKFKPTMIRVIASMKIDTVDATATLKIFVNGDVSPRITLTSQSLTYELKSGDCDISDLVNGKQSVIVKLSSDLSASLAYNELVDFMLIS
jgi:hypothetical protein